MEQGKLKLFEDFELDTMRGCLLRGGRPVHLRPQAYRLLKFLTENRGRLISKDQLFEKVWEGRAVTDDSLVQCLRDVRQALGEAGNRYLRNERGRGYIFDDEVSIEPQPVWTEQLNIIRVVEEEDEGEAEKSSRTVRPALETAVQTAGSWREFRSPRQRKALLVMSVVAVVVAAAAFSYFTYSRNHAKAAFSSIAVLPFINESTNPEMEYLSEGLSESLINSLAQLPNLKVIARSSSFQYKGKDVSPQSAAHALHVEAVLIGRVVQRGDNLVVSVELVDGRDATQVWGEQYSRRADDLQAVQEEIALAVSEKLRLRLSGAQAEQLGRRATQNAQAYQSYLNGLFSSRQRRVEDVRRALDYFNQAVAMDPNFALAWSGMANAHLAFAANSWRDPKEAKANAKAAALAAIKLDERSSQAHAILGVLKQHEWDWAGAEYEFKRAIALNPSLVEAHSRYSEYLSIVGRHEEALAEAKRAQELDPLSLSERAREAMVLLCWRRNDEALEIMLQIKRALPGSGSQGLALIYDSKGMYEEAITEHRRVISTYGETTGSLCYLGWALAGAGRRKEAKEILNRLTTTKEYVSPAELAGLYAVLGDKEGAFASLEKSYEAHDLQLQYLKIDSHYDSLRSDPRFNDLVRRVGLPN